jgi:hypothetical protein
MVAPVNDFDTRLQAQSPRTLAPRGGVNLSTTANVVLVNGSVGTPSVITLVATPFVVSGTLAWSTSPTVPLTIDSTGKIATLQYANMGTSSVQVTVTLTSNGLTYTDTKTVSQVAIGSLGYQGALDATRNNTAQGLLANRPTGANGDFYFATDALVLYQKVSGAWQAAGNNFTNTNQLTDGAGLGTTATWTGVTGSGKPDDSATVGAPAGTLVAGVAASTVATATTNFNSSNDRNSAAVTAPTVLTDGTAVDHTLRSDGAADISFEWSWSGNEGDIDGFLVYVYQSSSSAAYSFGTTPAAETVYTVPAAKRAFILFGAAATMYTTFGVQAYRAVDKDVNPTGAVKSLLVKPTLAAENPYQPSTNVAFSGNITGTVNGIPAANVNVWSSISGTGKPADNASSDLVLIGRSGVTVTGNTAAKTSGTAAWLGDAYSADSFTGGAYASVVAADTTSYLMFGLNSDPTTDASYTSLDYAIYFEATSGSPNIRVYENGSAISTLFGAWAIGDVFAVVYDGSSVKYLKNGTVFYTSVLAAAATPGQKLFFDSAFNTVGGTLKNVRFGPLSSNNWANVGGANKPADNATVGATIGVNLSGQITNTNAGTVVDISKLSVLSSGGVFRTAATGGRTEIRDNVIKVFDSSSSLRIKIGDLTL